MDRNGLGQVCFGNRLIWVGSLPAGLGMEISGSATYDRDSYYIRLLFQRYTNICYDDYMLIIDLSQAKHLRYSIAALDFKLTIVRAQGNTIGRYYRVTRSEVAA